MHLAVIRILASLKGREIRRQGGWLNITPPLSRAEEEALKPLKPALLAALEDGESLAGEEVLANPYRLAAVLLALYPLKPPLELESFWPGKLERCLVLDPLPTLRCYARNKSAPNELRLITHAEGGGLLVIEAPAEPPARALLVVRNPLGFFALEVLVLSEAAMKTYLETKVNGQPALKPKKLFLEVETKAEVFTEPDWLGALGFGWGLEYLAAL